MDLLSLSVSSDGATATIAIGSLLIMSSKQVASASMNLKRDLILGLNFQRTFKISQDIMDDTDLYLHIRRKIITFSQQAKNTGNHIRTHECTQIKPQSLDNSK